MLTATVVDMKVHLNIVSFLLITIFSSAARYSNGNMNLEHLVIWSRFWILWSFDIMSHYWFCELMRSRLMSGNHSKSFFLFLSKTSSWSSPPLSRTGSEHQLPGSPQGPEVKSWRCQKIRSSGPWSQELNKSKNYVLSALKSKVKYVKYMSSGPWSQELNMSKT